jgi:transcriptional regulator GlxA family with amidase domain
MSTAPTHIAFLVYDTMELLDFAGPFDVLTNAAHFAGNAPFRFTTVSPRAGEVNARGVNIHPDISVEAWDKRPVDILIIPGGFPPGPIDPVRPLLGDDFESVSAWISQLAPSCRVVMTVCVGALIVARTGLFDGKRVTTHRSLISLLQAMVGNQATVVRDKRFTSNEGQPAILTSAGVSCGIDLALHLVEKLLGPQLREATRVFMEYGTELEA